MKRLNVMKAASLVGLTLLLFPFCASSAWREGFRDANRLQLVGEGNAREDLPQVQRHAMAREAAIMDALSHWQKYCPAQSSEDGIARFRIENQSQRQYECDGGTCRARVVIEKSRLREQCRS